MAIPIRRWPQVIFNHQNPKFQNPDVRWALALAIDIKAVAMAGYRGAATLSAIAVPPTGTHPDYYHKPMQEWLASFELDTGKKVIKPYDPTIGQQIADMLRPSMGDEVPTDPAEIGASFGHRLVEAGSRGGGAAARARWFHAPRQRLVHAGRPALLDQARGRGRSKAGDDPRRLDDRRAVAALRHRCDDRVGPGGLPDASERRRLRGDHLVERRDLGRPSRT